MITCLIAADLDEDKRYAFERLKGKEVEVVIPPIWCTTDNAAMIAAAGYILYKEGRFSDLQLNAKSSILITI